METDMTRQASRLFIIWLLALGTTHAEVLLSGNKLQGGHALPKETPAMATQATYQWLYGNIGNVRGNTDSGIIKTDEADYQLMPDMQDNATETVGGAGAVYQSWDGGKGEGMGNGPFKANVATLQFDLKKSCAVSRVEVSAGFKVTANPNGKSQHSHGIGTCRVWVSDKANPALGDFTLWAEWNDDTPIALDKTEKKRDARITIVGKPVAARHVQIFFDRLADQNPKHASWHQMQIGEVMIFGDETTAAPAPKPAALSAPENRKKATLLSDNIKPGVTTSIFPSGTRVIATGATYRWVTAGTYATDSETLSTGSRPNNTCKCVFDGVPSGSATTQTFSKWRGGIWATMEIDLKSPFLISGFDVWSKRDKSRDTESVEILLSSDGKTYSSYGLASERASPREINRVIPIHGELKKPVIGRFVRLRIKRRREARQQQIGDIAIWGLPAPKDPSNYLKAGDKQAMKLKVRAIQSGAAILDWSSDGSRARDVKQWRIYRSQSPFNNIAEAELAPLQIVHAKQTDLTVYPLEPKTTYYFGVTAVYPDGEYPQVEGVRVDMPVPLSCRTFGDMLGINHFWLGGGTRGKQRPNADSWEQVALDLLGTTAIKHVRWWRTTPTVVEKMYQHGLGLITFPDKSNIGIGNRLGIFAFTAGNEPDLSGKPLEHYLAHLKKYYTAAKAAHPRNVISAPTTGLEASSIEWLDQFYAAGGKDYFDVLDLHTYCKTSGGHEPPDGYPPACPEVLFGNMKQVRSVMAKYGDQDKPVISTEFGYTECNVGNPAGTVTPEMKANYLVRGLIIQYALGFKRVFIYSFWDEGDDPYYTEHHFGLVDYEMQKKPAFYALKVLGDQLAACTLEGIMEGCSQPSFGYQFRDSEKNHFIAVVWDGSGQTASEFATKAREVHVIDTMGQTRKLLVDKKGHFRLPYGPSPVYMRADQPIRMLSQKRIASQDSIESPQADDGGLSLILETPVVTSLPGQTKTPVAVSLSNASARTITGEILIRDPQQKEVNRQNFEIKSRQAQTLRLPVTVSAQALDRFELLATYDGPYSSYAESRLFYVRSLHDSGPEPETRQARMVGYDKPVTLLCSPQLEVSVDVQRGARILEILDKTTGANQVNMDYDLLPKLQSTPYAYGIWDRVNKDLKNSPYRILRSGKGVLELEATSSQKLRVRKRLHVDTDGGLTLDLTITNQSDQPREVRYYLHPEYTVGGEGDSVTDVLLLPVEGDVLRLPFWTGLGEKKHAPLVQNWWAVLDSVSGLALRQDYSPGKFQDPRLWFGKCVYNLEMTSRAGLTLAPGESWKARLNWRFRPRQTNSFDGTFQ
jgi:hypothetical protein